MSAMTDYTEKKFVDWLTGLSGMPTIAGRFLALFTANPTDVGSQSSELAGGTYARQDISTAFAGAGATSGQDSNASTISFGAATANHGVVTHFGIMDASSAGNMLAYGELNEALAYNTGDVILVSVGQLVLTAA